MCGRPKVVRQDPEGDARKAAEKATAEANAKKAMRRGSTGAMIGSVLGGDDKEQQDELKRADSRKQAYRVTKSVLGGG